MSDTPRTDAAATGFARLLIDRGTPDNPQFKVTEIIPSDFARTLERRIAELERAASELLAAIQSVEPDVEISPCEAVAIMAMKDVLNRPAAKRQEG